jgi:ribonuclease III
LVYNKHVKIDLHIHSNASDGTLSPSEILSLACNLNLGAIAITDHDTIDGLKEVIAQGIPPSIKFLTGVEISATPPSSFTCSGSFHILGYSIRIDDPALNQTLGQLQEARRSRNPKIVDNLNKLGMDISFSDLIDEFGDKQLGRPHIAQIMVKKGFVGSINEAFDKYLGRGKPGYVDKYRIDCKNAIEIILGAGGIPVLAHPFFLELGKDVLLEELIITLKKMGLMGMEVYYPEHSQELIAHYVEIANRHGLLMTGGSDFHGSIKPDINMGSGKGDLFVPYELYERLINSVRPEPIKIEAAKTDLSDLEQKIHYRFNDINILEESLRHSSFVNEQNVEGMRDNERFEFLGDAVLNLVVGDSLMRRYPDLKEGDLSRMRAGLVNETQLAAIALGMDLGSYIKLGKGEIQTAGCEKKSILADAFEAVIAAVILDGGLDAAYKVIDTHFSTLYRSVNAPAADHDYKSRVQELVQVSQRSVPVYRVLSESGPDHDKTFRIQLKVNELRVEGIGKSKKIAEQDAAKKALEIIEKEET